MTQGQCWTAGSIELDAYIELWQQRIDEEGAVEKDDWDWYWAELVELGVVDPDSRGEFVEKFTNTGRTRATPRAGIAVIRSWPLTQAEVLERSRRLIGEVRAAGRVVLEER